MNRYHKPGEYLLLLIILVASLATSALVGSVQPAVDFSANTTTEPVTRLPGTAPTPARPSRSISTTARHQSRRVSVPNTGNDAAFQTVQVPMTHPAGQHRLRPAFPGNYANLNWITFA